MSRWRNADTEYWGRHNRGPMVLFMTPITTASLHADDEDWDNITETEVTKYGRLKDSNERKEIK